MKPYGRMWATLKNDLKFQYRHGFYWAYLIVLAVYIAVLVNLPPGEIKIKAAIFILFSDTAVVGIFFIGALILLEKGQNILESLFVTPLKLSEYLISKYFSLTLLALVASLAIVITVTGTLANFVIFTIGILFISISFISFGIAIAANSKTVNDYFYKITIYTFILFIPLLDFFELYHSPYIFIIPTQAVFIIFKAVFYPVNLNELVYATLMLLTTSLISYLWAVRRFNRFIILKIGAEK